MGTLGQHGLFSAALCLAGWVALSSEQPCSLIASPGVNEHSHVLPRLFGSTVTPAPSAPAGFPLCFLPPECKKCGLLTGASLGICRKKKIVTLLQKTRQVPGARYLVIPKAGLSGKETLPCNYPQSKG